MPFPTLETLPEDPILGLSLACKKDPRPQALNLGVGTYRNAEGKPYLFSSVRKAEQLILSQNKEYLPIDGHAEYIEQCLSLVFGESLPEGTFGCQTIGGSGALRIGAELLRTLSHNQIYISTPSWPNHQQIFSLAGLNVHSYPYYSNHSLDPSMWEAIEKMPRGSIVVFQGCCHNPTGIDPSMDEWKKLSSLLLEKDLIPFFDLAYQGFKESTEADVAPIRYFAKQGHQMFVAVSLSKNFGLYGERVGLLAVVTQNTHQLKPTHSHCKRLIRGNYSNPPLHGARIVHTILQDPSLKKEWQNELQHIRERIIEMRKTFVAELQTKQTKKDFSFLLQQSGMFSFSDLSEDQVKRLQQEHAIYLPRNGRLTIAGLNHQNIHHIIDAIVAVLL